VSEKGNQERDDFAGNLEKKVQRKLRARRQGDRGVWYGIGMMGLVGWAVAVPTLLFVALGIWMDRRWNDGVSWTLTLLLVGVVLGCLNAWFWVKRESRGD
jgi:ATP synthase protein I